MLHHTLIPPIQPTQTNPAMDSVSEWLDGWLGSGAADAGRDEWRHEDRQGGRQEDKYDGKQEDDKEGAQEDEPGRQEDVKIR